MGEHVLMCVCVCGCVSVHVTLDCSSFFHVCLVGGITNVFAVAATCSYSPHTLVSLLSLVIFLHFHIQSNQKGLTNQPCGLYLCVCVWLLSRLPMMVLSLSSLSSIVQHRLNCTTQN